MFTPDAWVNTRRTPRYYPDAVTLSATASVERIVDRIDTASPGCSVKDSFARLDLTGHGFRVLLEGEWIHHPPPDRDLSGHHAATWTSITDAAGLLHWEAAWGGGDEEPGLFPPALLTDASVTFLGGWRGDSLVAGCVANTTATVVGVSNVFILDDDLDAGWRDVLAAITARFPGRPVVGYESGDDLAAAVRRGFTAIGPLRVWLRDL